MTLHEYIEANFFRPFEWGVHDCVLFAANWVRMQTGLDPLSGIAPWHDARSAKRATDACGGMVSAIDARLARIAPSQARDGMLALREHEGRQSLLLFCGPRIVGPGYDGLMFINRMEAACAWHC